MNSFDDSCNLYLYYNGITCSCGCYAQRLDSRLQRARRARRAKARSSTAVATSSTSFPPRRHFARARSLGASDLARVGALGTRGVVVVGRSNRRATTPPWRPLSSSSARRRRGVIDRSHVREPARARAARGRRGDALGRRRARGRRASRVRVGVAFDEERSEEGVHDVERAPEGGDERERARGDRAVARDVRHRARVGARSRRAVARGVESHCGEVRHTRT